MRRSRVEEGRWTGTYWQPVVSLPRSSNRTCGFPASGFPTGFIARPTEERPHLGRLFLDLAIQLSLKHPDLGGCLQAHRPSLILCFFPSTPEVRVLPSASITRLPRYADPLRLPIWPPSLPAAFAARPLPAPGLPPLPRPPSWQAVLTTPMDRTGALLGCFPARAAGPVSQAGRHP